MAKTDVGVLLGYVRGLLGRRQVAAPDRILLERFICRRDETAFADLVRRYGPLVLGVCRRVLQHDQDAEDVFQATFLILARQAAKIRKPSSIGSWLYGVAYRLARKAKAESARRYRNEQESACHRHDNRATFCDPGTDVTWRELRGVLDEELARLPDKLRAPLLLCYLEGQTQDEAAQQLNWKKRTVRFRIKRGRNLLRKRLTRRGLALSTALSGSMLAPNASATTVSAALETATVKAGLLFACNQVPANLVSAQVLTLAKGGLRALVLTQTKVVTGLVMSVGLIGGATGWLLSQTSAKQAENGVVQVQPEEKPPKVDLMGDPLPRGAVARLGTVRFRFPSSETAFLPDSKTVVSIGQGNSIKLWNARTGQLVREIDTGNFTAGRGGFALSRDGTRLAVGGSIQDDEPGYRVAIRVFDIATGKDVRTIERPPAKGINALAMTPDGTMLFTIDHDGQLRVEEVATGAELLRQQFPGDVMASIAVSPDGSTLALESGPNTRKTFVWKWQAAEEPRAMESGRYRGRGLVFSPDGKLLAECSDLEPSVRLLDVASGRPKHKLELPDLEPFRHYYVAFSPDGKLIAAYGGTNDRDAVNLWDPATGKLVKRLDIGGALAFSPDGKLLVAGSQVWDFAASKDLSANDEAHLRQVERMVTGREDLVVTAGDDNTIRIWDATTGKQRLRMAQDSLIGGSIRALALSPDGTKLVSSSMRDDQVCLWEVASGKRIYRLAGHGKMGSVAAAAVFKPDGKSFLTWGAADMCLREWDVRTGKALAEYVIRPAGAPIPSDDDEPFERERKFYNYGVSEFTPDAKYLVFQGGDKCFVFDAANGKELRSFPSDGSFPIGMAAISPDSKLVLTSTSGKSVETKLPDGSTQFTAPKNHPVTWWDLTTGQVRKQIFLPEYTPGPVAFSPDGQMFAVASSRPGARIRLMETATGREVREIKGFHGTVRSLAFMPDGKRLVSGMDDSTALVWDLTKEVEK